ncbi:MAG: hypothetical protein ABIW47_07145 [Ginsengibacter sp.]|jgi:hypothetical protein
MENGSNVSTAEIENFLVRRLGEQEGAEIIEYVHSEIEKKVAERISEVKTETALWRSELKNEFYNKEDAIALEQKLVKRVSAVEGTIILWGFVFWITTLIAFYVIFKFVL